MTQPIHNISVIICAYTEDRWDDLVAAVRSVKEQTLPPDEIIVVIDHNPELLKRVRDNVQDVVVVENLETRGLRGARNSGIAVAQSQVIAFLYTPNLTIWGRTWLDQCSSSSRSNWICTSRHHRSRVSNDSSRLLSRKQLTTVSKTQKYYC